MQTVGRARGRGVGTAHNPGDGKSKPPQRRTKETGSRPKRRHPHFLTERIPPIGVESIVRRNEEGKEINFITRDNYIYLRESALNYARLSGKDLGHIPEGNTGACIADLYHKLAELEPSLNLNMEPVESRLRFVFWEQCDWGAHTLYWVRMKFLESLSPPMREAAMLFFRRLRKTSKMLTTNQCSDVDYVLEWLEEQQDGEEWMEQDHRADMAVVGSYKPGGKAYRLMEEIDREPGPDADLSQALSEVRPRKAKERSLLEILREGLRFTDSASPSIFDYEYDPCYDETHDERGIELARVIRFVYEDDVVQKDLIQSLDNDLNSGYGECIPCTRLYLTPDTGSVFAEDLFPSEFFAWIVKLLECVNYD